LGPTGHVGSRSAPIAGHPAIPYQISEGKCLLVLLEHVKNGAAQQVDQQFFRLYDVTSFLEGGEHDYGHIALLGRKHIANEALDLACTVWDAVCHKWSSKPDRCEVADERVQE